jgi:tripartite-type tricarboxylate transporter receptor subunit TctC
MQNVFSLSRRQLLLVAAAYAGAARAQDFPARPLRWLVGYPAGASSDFLARTVAVALGTQLGQQVIIDNRPGASGMIAAEAAAKSPGDGYTLWTGDNGTLIYNLGLFKKVPYEPMKDFATIGMMARVPIMIVAHPQAPYADGRALVEAMRRTPGTVNYATPGIGTPHNLAMEMLKDRAGLKATAVHYRGGAPAIQDLLGNQIGVMVLDVASAWPLLKAGKLKPLGVFSKQRHAALPDVASFVELGYTDVEAWAWQGVVAPSAIRPEVRARLASAFQLAMKSPEVVGKLQEYGWEVIGSRPDEMRAVWDADAKYWLQLIRERGITAES